MYSEGRHTDGDKQRHTLLNYGVQVKATATQPGHLHHHSPPLGPQRLSSQFDLESELWRRPRHHDRLGLRGLIEAVVLPLVLLVFFVFPLVNAVQA